MVKASRQDFHVNKPCRIFSPVLKNESQKKAWRDWPGADIMFLVGPAGGGKTHMAAVLAMKEIHAETASKIILVRPAIEAAGESLGYLPGEISDKLGPYLKPVKEEVEKICAITSSQAPPMEMVHATVQGRSRLTAPHRSEEKRLGRVRKSTSHKISNLHRDDATCNELLGCC
jgi:hypothetical protein